jgi:hypothetical protein
MLRVSYAGRSRMDSELYELTDEAIALVEQSG